jgi:hypothetical protein
LLVIGEERPVDLAQRPARARELRESRGEQRPGRSSLRRKGVELSFRS